ncbi:MAG TPA: ATP-binding protein [Gemmataceae bacterium]|nr:ATP-binding protein [Gemmataceae bacterium]
MHYYGRETNHMGNASELKLDPRAQCVECHSFVDLRPVFHRVEDMMRVLGFPFEDILAVQLAFREAAANAVRHGNCLDMCKRVDVRYLVTPDEVVLEVEDEGPGFDPTQVPDPFAAGGADRFKRLGLFLMRAHMNWVSFNAQGNRVTLGRRRSAL